MPGWSVVVPVKPAVIGKSRLGGPPELARAIALDTIAAALAAASVAEVIVVTDDADTAAVVRQLGGHVVPDPAAEVDPLNAAIRAGVAAASQPLVAALLGDVPALRPADLDAALLSASAHPRGVVPDADGTGTVLLTSAAGPLEPRFGSASFARHVAAAHVVLDGADALRRDVDTREHLHALHLADALGPRTSAVLAAADADGQDDGREAA